MQGKDAEQPMLDSNWEALLPPLPQPDGAMRTEEAAGMALVTVIVCACISGTHLGVWLMDFGDPSHWISLLATRLKILVYSEAALAFLCLAGLMFADPGVVKRSRETCLPLPAEVAGLLGTGQAISAHITANIQDGVSSYCVRCLVWRSPQRNLKMDGFHHCSTCQRCVRHFDHHCSLFGRCIAGHGLSGNMKYFIAINWMGCAGGITCFGSLLIGANCSGRDTWWSSWGSFALYICGFYAVLVVILCLLGLLHYCVDWLVRSCRSFHRGKRRMEEDYES